MQYVSDPTRGANLLDLVLCNDLFLISDCNVCPPINGCDHNSIEFSVQYKVPPEPEAPSIIVYDFKHADFEGLNMFLSNIDWNNVLTSTNNVDLMWNNFMSVINQAIGMYVPTKQLFTTNRKHFKQYPLYIRKLQNKKCAALSMEVVQTFPY